MHTNKSCFHQFSCLRGWQQLYLLQIHQPYHYYYYYYFDYVCISKAILFEKLFFDIIGKLILIVTVSRWKDFKALLHLCRGNLQSELVLSCLVTIQMSITCRNHIRQSTVNWNEDDNPGNSSHMFLFSYIPVIFRELHKCMDGATEDT